LSQCGDAKRAEARPNLDLMRFLHRFLARSSAMTGSPGPSTDQEDLQEEFLGALQALGGSAGNGRLRELLTWEEAPYEAVKASLLATGQLRLGPQPWA
jgi:hypothetical protein